MKKININKKVVIPVAAAVAAVIIVIIILALTTGETNIPDPVETVSSTSSSTVTTTPVLETTEVTTTYPPYYSGLSLKAQEYKKKNSDVIGWIRVQNSMINYPLLQADNNDMYIDKNIYKNPDEAGSIYLDFRCFFESGGGYQTPNLLIYGHNMRNGAMFGTLRYYLTKAPDFMEKNPFIELSSLDTDYQYKIFAFMYCNGVDGSDFEFWNYITFPMDDTQTDQECFDEYIANINKKSLVTTGVDVKLGDNLIALSTCAPERIGDDVRFVVLARRVRPGEDPRAGYENILYK